MNLPLNARMHGLANYTPGGEIRTDSRRKGINKIVSLDYHRHAHFSSFFSGAVFFFCFSTPIYIPERARAWEIESAPICFHDNRETVSTPPARATVTALFFIFYRRNSVVIFMTIRCPLRQYTTKYC